MNRKLAFAIIGFLIGIVISLSISFGRNVTAINNLKEQINISEARNGMFEYQLTATDKELKGTKLKLTGANQKIESLQINNSAYRLFSEDIKGRYIRIYAYAQAAQLILKAQGIDYMYTELPLGESD